MLSTRKIHYCKSPFLLERSSPYLPRLNLSTITYHFLANFRSFFIFSIRKRGSLGRVDNFRPINNTSPMLYVFEANVHDAIHDHLSTKNQLSPSQQGSQRHGLTQPANFICSIKFKLITVMVFHLK